MITRAALLLALLAAAACSTSKSQEAGPPPVAPPSPAPQAASGDPCGPTTCPAGQVCCNPSCGICTPPGGFCTQQFCEQAPASAGTCRSDADCRLLSDTCTSCTCRVLATGEEMPICNGPGVKCFADPCRQKTAACQSGRCQVLPLAR